MLEEQEWKQCNSHIFWGEIAPHEHLVQIYENDSVFLNSLSSFVASGFIAGDAVIILATESHIKALELRLEDIGFNMATLIQKKQYIPIEANVALSKFMVNDMPDELFFNEFVKSVVSGARKGSGRIRAFGELVALLWEQGNIAAVIKLEGLWNKFCETDAFCLFCAYPDKGFTDATASLQNICAAHTKVINGMNNSGDEVLYRE